MSKLDHAGQKIRDDAGGQAPPSRMDDAHRAICKNGNAYTVCRKHGNGKLSLVGPDTVARTSRTGSRYGTDTVAVDLIDGGPCGANPD